MSSLRFCVDSSINIPFLPLQIPTRSLAEWAVFGPKRSSLERLSTTQDPTKGQFNFFTTPFALRQVTGRQQVYENPCECVYCVLRWVCVALRLGGRYAHAHVLACSQTNPTKPQEPRQRHER